MPSARSLNIFSRPGLSAGSDDFAGVFIHRRTPTILERRGPKIIEGDGLGGGQLTGRAGNGKSPRNLRLSARPFNPVV